MSKSEQSPKPYTKPHLREYGDVRLLSEQLTGTKGVVDGGFYGMQQLKTGG